MSTNMAAVLAGLAAACMVGAICLIATDIYLLLKDQKARREAERAELAQCKKETPED